MGRSSSTQTLEGDQRISQTNKNQRCSALLLCLPLWPSLLLSQKLTPNSFTATSLVYQSMVSTTHMLDMLLALLPSKEYQKIPTPSSSPRSNTNLPNMSKR